MPRQSGEINAFEDHGETTSGEFDGGSVADTCRKAKSAGFKPLEPDDKAGAFPVEDFHQGLCPIEKDEKMSAERIGGEFAPNDGDETVERLPHIDGRSAEGNTNVVRNG